MTNSKLLYVFIFFAVSLIPKKAYCIIHKAPITLVAQRDLKRAQYYPLTSYRVMATDKDGKVKLIPFQIDEKDKYGDFILDKGMNAAAQTSNKIFDFADELSVMGNDVGEIVQPKTWDFQEPDIIYQVSFSYLDKKGAVFIGLYVKKTPPPPIETSYVSFDLDKAQVSTSQYHYEFNNKNYLVVRGVDIIGYQNAITHLIDSSTFYLKTDLQYLPTFQINQQDIESELDAFRTGPVRAIARVNFNYSLMGLSLKLGMYTEVSFFSNSVNLPAIIDNPLNGKSALNPGSLFYYGFALAENPETLKISSNMAKYEADYFKKPEQFQKAAQSQYWLTGYGPKYMVFLEFTPSKQMIQSKSVPMFYTENIDGQALKRRETKAAPLSKSQVNMAVSFDLTSLTEGTHEVGFRIFIENLYDPESLRNFQTLNKWTVEVQKQSLAYNSPPEKATLKKPTEKTKSGKKETKK